VAVTVTFLRSSVHTVLRPHSTDATGHASVTMRVPLSVASGAASVAVNVSAGYLRESASATFNVAGSSATQASQAPSPTPTSGTPSHTTNRATARLAVHAQILAVSATSPQPVWVVVNVLGAGGKVQPGASVTAVIQFAEGSVTAHGTADGSGKVTLRINTTLARKNEHVSIRIAASSGSSSGSTDTSFALTRSAQQQLPTGTATLTETPTDTATPTPISTETPTFTETATATAQEVDSGQPDPTVTPTPYPTPFFYLPTDTPIVTDTPTAQPTWTPSPTDTPALLPTVTFTPLATATQLPTALPSATPTQAPDCPGSQNGCIQATLNLINSTRAQYGLPPYTLNMTQSDGIAGGCVGSVGHSIAMAGTGSIWHVAPGDNPQQPTNPASFWNDVCVSGTYKGENVGENHSGDEYQDIVWIHQQMMSEQHDAAYCSYYDNHACNILSSTFHQIGIGLYNDNGTTWLTTDFIS
jgi:hypothetical protein